MAIPVTDVRNRFVGVLAGLFSIGADETSSFYGDIVKLNWGEGRNVYIVDSTAKVIFHTNMAEIGKDL